MHIISYKGHTPEMRKTMPNTTIAVVKCYDTQTVYTVYFYAPTGAVRTYVHQMGC